MMLGADAGRSAGPAGVDTVVSRGRAPGDGIGEKPEGNQVLLDVSDLHCSFGGVQAVAGASFTVTTGSLTGMIGPNGAGKSTVINIIGGQVRPTAGTVRFGDRAVGGMSPHEISRRGITRTFQTANVFGRLTVLENLLLGAPQWRGETLGAALAGKWLWRRQEGELIEKAQGILERFGLTFLQNERAGELSGGQRRLVEIMRALMADPKLLLLDEPMAGINPTLARSIAEILVGLRDDGLTMVMVEHELHLLERICDPVICMVQGRVLAEGSMAELRANPEVVDAYLQG
jgi:ABC-type branched-subunit amino acid transport system ATPase component